MVFKMAHLSRAHGNLVVLFHRVIKPSFFTGKSNAISRISEGVFSGLNVLQSRGFKPYSVTPKKFLKKKNRNKSDRDDVYFTTDQVDPSYSINDAIDIIKAYDLFGNEKLDLILKMDLGEGKVNDGLLFHCKDFSQSKHCILPACQLNSFVKHHNNSDTRILLCS